MVRKTWVLLFAILIAIPIVSAAQDQPPQSPAPGMGPMMQHRMGPRPGMMRQRMAPGPGMMGRGFQGPPDSPGPGFGPPFAGPRPGFGRGFGRHFGSGFGAGRGAMRMGALRELNLTDAQKTRLQQMQFDRQKAAIQNRAAMETRQLELRQLLSSDKPDRDAVGRKIQEIGELRTARMKAAMEERFALQDLLTPEQRQKLREWREPPRGGPGPAGPGPERGVRPQRRAPAPPAAKPAPNPPSPKQ